MSRNYSEGTWFAVPLRQGGYCTGVVARAARGKPIILCYFFDPRRDSVPTIGELSKLKSTDAIAVMRVGDLGLIRGRWPMIGDRQVWNRLNWPVPVFIQREVLPPFRNWRVYYAEDNPNEIIKREPEPNERPELPDDALSGSGAAEIKLTMLLERIERLAKPTPQVSTGREDVAKASMPIERGPFRIEVLSQLSSFGSDNGKPHSFDFYLYFQSEVAADCASKKIQERERLTTEVLSNPGNGRWLCRVSTVLIPDSASLDELAEFLKQIANASNGDFDGWESNIVKS